MGFLLRKPYPYSLYGWGFLHFRYLKCLVKNVTPPPPPKTNECRPQKRDHNSKGNESFEATIGIFRWYSLVFGNVKRQNRAPGCAVPWMDMAGTSLRSKDCHDNLSNKHLLVGQCWWFQTREVSHTSHLYGPQTKNIADVTLPPPQEKKHHDSMVLPPNKITKTPNGMYINVHTYILIYIYIHPLFYSLWKKNESQLSFKTHPFGNPSIHRNPIPPRVPEKPWRSAKPNIPASVRSPKAELINGAESALKRVDYIPSERFKVLSPGSHFLGEDSINFPIFCSHKSWGFKTWKDGCISPIWSLPFQYTEKLSGVYIVSRPLIKLEILIPEILLAIFSSGPKDFPRNQKKITTTPCLGVRGFFPLGDKREPSGRDSKVFPQSSHPQNHPFWLDLPKDLKDLSNGRVNEPVWRRVRVLKMTPVLRVQWSLGLELSPKPKANEKWHHNFAGCFFCAHLDRRERFLLKFGFFEASGMVFQ